MVLNYGEEMTMPVHKSVSDELKDLQKKRRELAKREKELKAQTKIEKDIGKWQKIMDARSACLKILSDADLGMRMTLTRLEKFPDYYVYQHPVNKKLKTSNRNEEWVLHYIGEQRSAKGGMSGNIEDLMNTARESRYKTWKRLNNKTKKRTPVPFSGGKKGKAKAVGSVGVG